MGSLGQGVFLPLVFPRRPTLETDTRQPRFLHSAVSLGRRREAAFLPENLTCRVVPAHAFGCVVWGASVRCGRLLVKRRGTLGAGLGRDTPGLLDAPPPPWGGGAFGGHPAPQRS